MTSHGIAMTPTAVAPRPLSFATEADAAAEVQRLRAGGYQQTGNWTLPQACRHLWMAIDHLLVPPGPTPVDAAPEALALLDAYLTTGRPPPGFASPERLVPPADCDGTDVDAFGAALDRLAAFPHPTVQMGRFGVVPIDLARRFHLRHAAHHLAFLIPA